MLLLSLWRKQRMAIKKVCCYTNGGKNINILPSILITPKEDGFIIAFKWLTGHLGFYFTHSVDVGHHKTL